MLRVAFYSHDTYGLGHIRRCLKIAWALDRRFGPLEGRIFTGSPWADHFPAPAGFRYVKLAPVIKTGPDEYRPRKERRSLDETIRERCALITAGFEDFDPHLLVVDNVPTGLRGEILPALERLRRRRDCKVVLALRDVIDDESVTRRQWERSSTPQTLTTLYDEVWIFGGADSPVSALLTPEVSRKAVYCGCLGVNGVGSPAPVTIGRPSPGANSTPLVLLTGGGGGDARPLVEAYLEAIESLRPTALHRIVLGPDYPDPVILERRDVGDLGVEIVGFDRGLPAAMSDADVVVAMAGYNTVCEALALGCRLVLVPRIWPRREQWLRARALGDAGRAEVITPDQLTPVKLWRAVEAVLSRPKPSPTRPLGAMRAAERAVHLLERSSQVG